MVKRGTGRRACKTDEVHTSVGFAMVSLISVVNLTSMYPEADTTLRVATLGSVPVSSSFRVGDVQLVFEH
jgi:hypothetical protein